MVGATAMLGAAAWLAHHEKERHAHEVELAEARGREVLFSQLLRMQFATVEETRMRDRMVAAARKEGPPR